MMQEHHKKFVNEGYPHHQKRQARQHHNGDEQQQQRQRDQGDARLALAELDLRTAPPALPLNRQQCTEGA